MLNMKKKKKQVQQNLALWIRKLGLKEEKTIILILVGSMERIMVMRLSILVVDLELVRIDLVPIMEELVQ